MEPEVGPLDGLDLTTEQIDALAYLINSPSYLDVFEPMMIGLERSMIESLINPTQARKWDKSDDYLRGGILVLRALRNFPRAAVGDARDRQFAEDQKRTDEQKYVDRADAGGIGPLGFNYDPAEDF